MAGNLIVFLLFLLQFIYFPIGVSHFETPKVYAAETGIFLLVLIVALQTDTSRVILVSQRRIQNLFRRTFRDSGQARMTCFVLLVFLTFIHLLFFATNTTFAGNAFRLQGVFLLWLLIIFAFLASKITIDKKINPFFIFGCLFVQLIFALLIDGGVNERAVGTLGEPNALAAAVVFGWPFLFFTKKQLPGYLKWIGLGVAVSIILLADSRSGMIAITLQLLFLLCVSKFRLNFKKAVIVTLILLLLTYTLPFIEQKSLYEKRSEVWQIAAISGLESPVLGHGFGNTEYALKSGITETKTNLSDSFVDSSHNIFLDWWVEGGIIGLVCLLILLFQTVNSFIIRKASMELILLLGILAALSFNPASVVSLVCLWWLIGRGLFSEL